MRQLHWILTLRWLAPDGEHTQTFDGTGDFDGRGTSRQAFAEIVAMAAEMAGIPAQPMPNVLFFSLKRNNLSETA
ncbi:hypothetical protein AB0L97_32875 [Nocardia sp. NPDC051911]|uniref:hypothetical protein n=1 Tax=Nocardia sp. NPDC051911 TaxID=3154648 RepID=UPI00343916B1